MRAICETLIVSVPGSQSADRVWKAAKAKRPGSSSLWPRNTTTSRQAPRPASAESDAPTTSLSAVARDATVTKELHPVPQR